MCWFQSRWIAAPFRVEGPKNPLATKYMFATEYMVEEMFPYCDSELVFVSAVGKSVLAGEALCY